MINIKKSVFLRDQITILGYQLGNIKVKPNSKKINLQLQFEAPTTLKAL